MFVLILLSLLCAFRLSFCCLFLFRIIKMPDQATNCFLSNGCYLFIVCVIRHQHIPAAAPSSSLSSPAPKFPLFRLLQLFSAASKMDGKEAQMSAVCFLPPSCLFNPDGRTVGSWWINYLSKTWMSHIHPSTNELGSSFTNNNNEKKLFPRRQENIVIPPFFYQYFKFKLNKWSIQTHWWRNFK